MKTLPELLRDADPLGYEPHGTGRERRLDRQVLVAAPRAAEWSPWRTRAVAAIVALALVAAAAAAVSRFWSSVGVRVQAAEVRFEVRLAEETSAPGLREAAISDSSRTVYLHDDVVITNGDIAQAQVVQGDTPSTFHVALTFSAEGAGKMVRATGSHIGRPLAILIDGKVVMAPVVRAAIGTAAVISGTYTKAEAERIVAGVRGR